MKEWLRETHGPAFELLRHFLRRLLDSDIATSPGQMSGVLIGTVPVVFQWFFLLIGPLRAKYAYLNHLPVPGPYREAVRADELCLITLMMSAIGLLTAIKWQSLFPSLLDCRALGSLPLRPRQIFGAKLAALLLVAAAALATLNFLPAMAFPALSSGHWAIHASLGARTLAHTGASLAASAFFFFGLVALQGVLLNLLRPRAFGRATVYLQGSLIGIMLGLIVLSFSIQPQITHVVVQPEWARWLPPVWFLGLYQTLAGDPDPAMRALAHWAEASLAIAVVLAFSTYLVSYRHHRTLLMEGISGQWTHKRSGGKLLEYLSPDPRQQAVVGFMMRTLARSRHHRMVLMGYAGLGFALLLTGLTGDAGSVEPSRAAAAGFVYYHILAIVFLVIGARHLFSLPTELKANWIFRITEGEGRAAWLTAVDRFALFWSAAVMLAIPLPLEIRLLGWRGVAEAALLLATGILCFEWAFSGWEKLPFTCSHLPVGAPLWMVVGFLGLIEAVIQLHAFLLAALYHRAMFLVVLAALLGTWMRFHRNRRQGWAELRIKYDDGPEPEIHGLNLMK
jgi:hypothetical protein